MSKPLYVYWYWQRAGNDGRRPSGVVYQKSVLHILKGKKTICGRQPYSNGLFTKTIAELEDGDKVCGLCIKGSK